MRSPGWLLNISAWIGCTRWWGSLESPPLAPLPKALPRIPLVIWHIDKFYSIVSTNLRTTIITRILPRIITVTARFHHNICRALTEAAISFQPPNSRPGHQPPSRGARIGLAPIPDPELAPEEHLPLPFSAFFKLIQYTSFIPAVS